VANPRRTLVAAYQRLAEIANSFNDADEAARIVARAVVHAEALVQHNPSDKMARLHLSQIYREEAESLGRRSKYEEALTRIRESRVILEKLMAENPLDTRFNTGLLFVLSGEGELLELKGEPLAALPVYRHQLEIARQRMVRDQKDSTAQIGVAVALRQLGDIMVRSRRIDEARAYLDEGCEIMAAVVARDPANSWAVDVLAALVRLRAEALVMSSDAADRARACLAFEEARHHWDGLKSRNAFPPYSAQAYQLTQSRVTGCETRNAGR
jgi:tetratricopeptide (TPR) repeat protein